MSENDIYEKVAIKASNNIRITNLAVGLLAGVFSGIMVAIILALMYWMITDGKNIKALSFDSAETWGAIIGLIAALLWVKKSSDGRRVRFRNKIHELEADK